MLLGLVLLAVVVAVSLSLGEGFLPELPDPVGPDASPAPSAPAEEAPALQVYFLDVGQGDSELVQIPNGSGTFNMLIDTGEYAYADGLCEMLTRLGVERIDALVMSHPHTDHMGCMARVAQRFAIGRLYMPVVPEAITPTVRAYERLLEVVEEQSIPVTRLVTGAKIQTPDSVTVQVLAPEADADWEDLNNYSAVLRITAGEVSFLFTGDAETQSEQVILQSGADISAQVLKCGHHGSSTSTGEDFFQAVAPEYAVISCGKNNSYGHPHRETRALLQKYHTTTYRTDEDGTVLAVTDGKTVAFETGLPSVQAAED